jgi:hypothetical protein
MLPRDHFFQIFNKIHNLKKFNYIVFVLQHDFPSALDAVYLHIISLKKYIIIQKGVKQQLYDWQKIQTKNQNNFYYNHSFITNFNSYNCQRLKSWYWRRLQRLVYDRSSIMLLNPDINHRFMFWDQSKMILDNYGMQCKC